MNLNVSGLNAEGSASADNPLTLDYRIDGGEDDFNVNMRWVTTLGDSFTLFTDSVLTSERIGSFEITPSMQASYIGYSFTVSRNGSTCEGVYSPRKYQVAGGEPLQDLPGAIAITTDQSRVNIGDTVTATYRKLSDEVTILDGQWQWKTNSPYGVAVARAASASSWDVAERTESEKTFMEGEVWFDLLYRDSAGTYYKASSEHVVVGDWHLISYTWSPDNTKLTAVRVSALDSAIVEEETVETYASISPPTWDADGYAYYRASFVNNAFNVNGSCWKNITIPALSSMSVLTLPGSILSVQDAAFSGDENVEAVILPQGCDTIEKNAFENCTRLRYILIGPETLVEEGALNGCRDVVVFRGY